MLESVGDRIKEAIKGSGLTQSAVADQCGVSKQAITGWIKTSSIDKQNLLKLCKITNANYEWMLSGKKPQDNELAAGIKDNKGMYEVTRDNAQFLSVLDQLDTKSRHQLSIYMEGLLAGQSGRTELDAKTPHTLPAKNKPTLAQEREEK